jgi:urease accessory protein
MRAAARIVAVADGSGGTTLAVLRGEPPLLPRRTGTGTDPVEVHLVGGAAGPVGGDRLRLDIEVGPGARLCVRTVAATIAFPGRDRAPSTVELRATVDCGGWLWWLPEPLIAVNGCAHTTLSTVELSAGAGLVWRDELVCGRHREPPGAATLSTTVNLDGRPLYRHELSVGPGAAGWDGPAVLGSARAAGSVLVVDPHPTEVKATVRPDAAVLPLAGPATLICAVGPDHLAVRASLDEFCEGIDTYRQRDRKASETPSRCTSFDSRT